MLNLTNDVSRLDRYGAGTKNNVFDIFNSLSLSSDAEIELKTSNNIEVDEILNTIDSLKIYEIIMKRDSIIMTDPEGHFKKTEQRSFWGRFFDKREIFNAVIQKDTVYEFSEISPSYNIDASYENRALPFHLSMQLRAICDLNNNPEAFLVVLFLNYLSPYFSFFRPLHYSFG